MRLEKSQYMSIPAIGKRKMTRHHISFEQGARVDFRTSPIVDSQNGIRKTILDCENQIARRPTNEYYIHEQYSEPQKSMCCAIFPGILSIGIFRNWSSQALSGQTKLENGC
jgi:hypothetical protein